MQLDHLEILSYICNYNVPLGQSVTVSSSTCSLMHVQIKHSLAHTATRFNPSLGWYKICTYTVKTAVLLYNKQMAHIWYIFLFFSVYLWDIVPNITNLVLRQQSSFNSVGDNTSQSIWGLNVVDVLENALFVHASG